MLVQPEMESGRSPLVSIPPLGGDFQGIGVYRYDGGLGQRKKVILAPPFIVSINPPGYPSAWLRPRRARFHFPGRNHCTPNLMRRFAGQVVWQYRWPSTATEVFSGVIEVSVSM